MNELRTNEFYLKKLYRSAQVTDADKDGVITRADYDLMIKRYNELGMPEENKQELSDAMYGMCGSLGLTDYSKSLTYDEIVQSWIDNVEKGEHAEPSFKAMDTDGDGVISHDEFVAYHYEYFHTSEDKLHSSHLYGPLQ
ncbi:sarcoplasmic calcium-binding [Paramuricea clavata]|uniref:Sarcoplasmic calcium-binding n=1 Tax=Paramuricea clavata TaxID=317549 RepID=A0A6S7G0U6_PARCT|nr:sarcoplasmic calcium-binding [Paramuricea clavata]